MSRLNRAVRLGGGILLVILFVMWMPLRHLLADALLIGDDLGAGFVTYLVGGALALGGAWLIASARVSAAARTPRSPRD